MRARKWLSTVGLFLLATLGQGCKEEPKTFTQVSNVVAGTPGAAAKEAAQGGIKREDASGVPVERKIIVSANVHLVANDFAKGEEDLQQLIKAHTGYVAQAEVSGTPGSSRQGLWKVRIPAGKFPEFREAVKKLGELVRYSSDANDVTEEYFDLAVRIKNKEAEVADIRKLHDKGSAKTEDVLLVQRELHRATGELEQMKGRQRVIENLTALTTVTVQMQERGTYVPPDSATFDTAIGRTFFGSIDALVKVAKMLVLAMVALAPWLSVIALIVFPIWWISRRFRVAVPIVTKGHDAGSEAKPQ